MELEDRFEKTLEEEILKLEKWAMRLEKKIWFLKEAYIRSRYFPASPMHKSNGKIEQLNFFEK